jgi:Tol biopolymer transport system component
LALSNDTIHLIEGFTLDLARGCLTHAGKEVHLRPQTYEVLKYLVENRGRLISKDKLIEEVWHGRAVTDGSLGKCIEELREALGTNALKYIRNVRGRGYIFDSAADPGAKIAESEQIDVLRVVVTDEENDRGAHYLAGEIRKHKLLYALGLSAAFALILAGAVLSTVLLHRTATKSRLPFENMKMTRATTSGNVTSAAVSPDGRYVVYAMSREGQESLWLKQTAIASDVQIAKPEPILRRALTFSPDGNSIFYVIRNRHELGELYQLPALGGIPKKLVADIDSTVTFSPDGRQISFFRGYPEKGESKLVIANADGTQERELVSRKRPDYFPTLLDSAPSWSPVSAVIACPTGSGGNADERMTVVAIQPESGDIRQLASRRWWYVGHAAWLHDGSGLVIIAKERASDPSQIWHLSYPSGETRRITNDLNNYVGVSMTRHDPAIFVTVQSSVLSSILVAPNEVSAREISISSVEGVAGISWTPDGQIVYPARLKGNQDIYLMSQDGSNQRQLTANASDNNWPTVSSDGRYIIFVSNRTGSNQIWRMNLDGTDPKQLTNANDPRWPRCTPDSQWVVYASLSNPAGIYKVSIEGGDSVQLTDGVPLHPAISPDGKLLATAYREDPGADKTAVYSFNGGAPLKVLNFSSSYLSWQLDGNSLAYIDQHKRNIISQPIDGPQVQLTHFKDGTITAFDWSRDGRLACVRKVVIADAVVVSSNEQSLPE